MESQDTLLLHSMWVKSCPLENALLNGAPVAPLKCCIKCTIYI